MAETTIHHILDELAEAATDHRDKGGKFERLIRAYLTTDPLYVSRYSDVWLWTDWPDRGGKADTGIDLVAKERDTGAMVAIQCKFYAPSYTLQKGDIDSFFTASGKAPFASRLIVSTTDKWSKHAEDALDAQQIPCARLRVQDLEDSAVDWSKFSLAKPDQVVLRTKKKPFKHQQAALKAVAQGFKDHERGKLIMACGTGKTYTSLKVVEQETPSDGLVLFLVPSISLLSQTLKEWTAQATDEIRAFAVCSDTKVGKHSEDIAVHDLAFPATTDAKRLGQAIAARLKGDKRRTVIFSTYQSIDVISQAQKKHGLGEFDLIVCDEAHRTTGVTLADDEESAFVRVHDPKFLVAKHRLYMTATPRIYADESKSKAEEGGAEIASMDDETKFGPEFHRLGFGEAVSQGLLADYKVMVLAVDEKSVSKTFQSQLADENHELNLDDAVKIVGCWNGLSKRLATTDGDNTAALDPHPMKRAVAFARDIKASKHLANLFPQVVDQYIDGHDDEALLRCEVEHVDGTYNVLLRNQKLDWLKEETGDAGNLCRILSNARCLSEGVDVPALDAVLFLNPRDSVVDVVQSVGRVMRRAEGKKYGYIILPIGVPADLTPEEALKDNKRYKVVWQVLQALRAHDDRFNALVNKIELNKTKDDQLQIIGVGGGPGEGGEGKDGKGQAGQQIGFAFPHLEEWRNAIYAKIVQKVGDRKYLEQWAKDVALIAERHTARIQALLTDPDSKASKAFDKFLKGLHQNINPSISKDDAIEMLSQHLITKPVFESLFEGYKFAENNPVSVSMDKILRVLDGQALEKETESLSKFYASVRQRVEGVDNAEGKQKIIVELYEKFFKSAFPKMVDRLGIVYTPVPAVDFIIRSADEVLRAEFGQGLADEGVHILDPFTGTGTFMVRLLQSGLIPPEAAKRKFQGELHANEIVLLAYYIAAINIEEAYHGLTGGDYTPFDGIVLTDTFQMTEKADGSLDEEMFPQNNKRAKHQATKDIRVIIGNPPYSAQQDSENSNTKNLDYPALDKRIGETYAARSNAKLLKNLYDSYVRAIRWSSDRIKDRGIVCFISNGSFIEANNLDGLRKALAAEFSSVHVFNLRGNQRTSGEQSRKEGGKFFDSGSRNTVAITLLVRNPERPSTGVIHYHEVADYLTRNEKLDLVRDAGSMAGLSWRTITPNEQGDWTSVRDPAFAKFMPLGVKDDPTAIKLFNAYSLGVVSSRDSWVYNFSSKRLASNMERMISFYNEQREVYARALKKAAKDSVDGKAPEVESVVSNDATKISWSRALKADVKRQKPFTFDASSVVVCQYRPFTKQAMYFNRRFNEMVYQQHKLFPTDAFKNVAISATGSGANKPFSALIADRVIDYEMISKGQCFPLYYYEESEQADLYNTDAPPGWVRRDAITDDALAAFQKAYGDKKIGKEDLFYYVYGILHSPEYKQRFEADLKKMIPRVPFAGDFWAFSRAGRDLAQWHLNYETVEPYPLGQAGELPLGDDAQTKVVKMAWVKNRVDGKLVEDKTSLKFNAKTVLTGIPAEAHEYVVNGKPAIEWLIERYQVSTDKSSNITNDPNDWAAEHGDPAYIINLVKRIVRVSVETMKIVKGLPALNERKA
ncbi:type ISP restriction/modification enzyme [Stenotrophomonas sp. GD03937]|uniref:DEAD/DEAH box helicase n=1 Tax=Stenotrophomonas sp. GD03937 TaxID=2975408 RepID=UPI00244D1E5A|nr:type ISP restriction/modification enzyme [Stenotrophomonas sp. GD03937]MDH1274159.1 DEAD/DEAH box helicase family protein [Stenotrophomonas sp. GD03937]